MNDNYTVAHWDQLHWTLFVYVLREQIVGSKDQVLRTTIARVTHSKSPTSSRNRWFPKPATNDGDMSFRSV